MVVTWSRDASAVAGPKPGIALPYPMKLRLHKNMRIFEYTTEYTRNYDYDTMSSYAKLLDIHLSSIRISYDCNTI